MERDRGWFNYQNGGFLKLQRWWLRKVFVWLSFNNGFPLPFLLLELGFWFCEILINKRNGKVLRLMG
jgi:hypothetical protein